jgi:hypothetical protein
MKKFALTLLALMLSTSAFSAAHACPSVSPIGGEISRARLGLRILVLEMRNYSPRSAEYTGIRETVVTLTENLNSKIDDYLFAVNCHVNRGDVRVDMDKDALLKNYEELLLQKMSDDGTAQIGFDAATGKVSGDYIIARRAYRAIGRSEGAFKIVESATLIRR